MKWVPKYLVAFFLIIFFSGPIFCQLAVSSSFSTLESFGSARLLALGLSSAAHPADISFSALNPACLNSSHINQWSITSQNRVGGIYQGSLTIGLPGNLFKNKFSKRKKPLNAQRGGLVFTPNRFFLSLGADYYSSGQLEQRDANGNLLGLFYASEVTPRLAFSLDYGKLSLGFGAKLPIISYGVFTSQAIAADFGMLWSTDSSRKQIAFVLRNVGRNFEYFSLQRERLPLNLQISFSQKLQHAPFRLNITYENIQNWNLQYLDPQLMVIDPLTGTITYEKLPWYNNFFRHISSSVEAQLGGRLFLQLGYDFRRQMENRITSRRVSAGVSTGVTFKAGKMEFQFGSSLYNIAGRVNQFSLIRSF